MRKGIISKLRHVLRSYYTAYCILLYVCVPYIHHALYYTALHVNGHNIYIGVVKITNKI